MALFGSVSCNLSTKSSDLDIGLVGRVNDRDAVLRYVPLALCYRYPECFMLQSLVEGTTAAIPWKNRSDSAR